MWFELALAGGILAGLSSILNRSILKEFKDPWIYSFYYSFLGALFSLPLLLFFLEIPTAPIFWILLILSTVLIVLGNYLGFASYNYLSPSWIKIIGQTQYIWLILFSTIFLSEYLSTYSTIGAVLIITSGILTIRKNLNKTSLKGIIITLGTAFFSAISGLIIKMLLENHNPLTVLFFLFFFPAILNMLLIPNFKKRAINAYKIVPKIKFIIIALLGFFMNVCLVLALWSGKLTETFLLLGVSSVIIMTGEYFFLKEKEHVILKVIGLILGIIGIILIRFSAV